MAARYSRYRAAAPVCRCLAFFHGFLARDGCRDINVTLINEGGEDLLYMSSLGVYEPLVSPNHAAPSTGVAI